MYQKITFWVFIIFIFSDSYAQEPGYRISFSIEGIEDPVLYLESHYGNHCFIMDSAHVKAKKEILFSSKKKVLPDGIYSLANKAGDIYLEFIVEHERNFSISSTLKTLKKERIIKNSEENVLFFEFQKARSNNQEDEINFQQFIETSPQSLMAKYIKAQYLPIEIPSSLLKDSSDTGLYEQYNYLIEHYFDQIDLNDERLLRTPLHVNIGKFFTEIIPQESGVIVSQVKDFISHIQNQEVKNYYLSSLIDILDQNNPAYGAALVYLFDQYCPDGTCHWLEENYARIFKKKVERIRKLLPGSTIPPLTAYDLNHKAISTASINHDYILLWFWDPDCDHCIEETPKWFEFYHEFKDFYDLEVYAISVTEDEDRWKKFIEQH
ncbi:MAG: redoxin domain-containing protein, partial [Bacteroidales bacterium]